ARAKEASKSPRSTSAPTGSSSPPPARISPPDGSTSSSARPSRWRRPVRRSVAPSPEAEPLRSRSDSWEEGLRLDTDRLRLRMPTLGDADALYDLFADSEVMHGLGKEPVSAAREARAVIEEWIAAWRTIALGPFMIETATNGRMVGQAGLMIFDRRGWTPSTWDDAGSHAQPELGWALIRAHWGHGYATEAAAAI